MSFVSIDEMRKQKLFIDNARLQIEGKGLKACVFTLGCQQNEADSERMRGILKSLGYEITYKEEEADLLLVNTDNFTVKTIAKENYCASGTFGSYDNFTGGIDFRSNIVICSYTYASASSPIVLKQIIPYSSHTKLPAPVVKTSTTTMKVTYDYYIQVPNYAEAKGKEFSWE